MIKLLDFLEVKNYSMLVSPFYHNPVALAGEHNIETRNEIMKNAKKTFIFDLGPVDFEYCKKLSKSFVSFFWSILDFKRILSFKKLLKKQKIEITTKSGKLYVKIKRGIESEIYYVYDRLVGYGHSNYYKDFINFIEDSFKRKGNFVVLPENKRPETGSIGIINFFNCDKDWDNIIPKQVDVLWLVLGDVGMKNHGFKGSSEEALNMLLDSCNLLKPKAVVFTLGKSSGFGIKGYPKLLVESVEKLGKKKMYFLKRKDKNYKVEEITNPEQLIKMKGKHQGNHLLVIK